MTEYTYYVYAYFPHLNAHQDVQVDTNIPIDWAGIEQIKAQCRDGLRKKEGVDIPDNEPVFFKNIFLLSDWR